MSTTETVKVFLLGAIATLLLATAINSGARPAYAADQSGAGSVIALTSNVGSNNVGLFLIDTSSQHVAYYLADSNSKFTLAAARNYGNDVALDDAPFQSRGYSVADAKKHYNTQQGKSGK